MAAILKKDNNPDATYGFVFNLETEPPYMNIGAYRHALYSMIMTKDSIFNPYPIMGIVFRDDEGIITEQSPLIEGLKFKIKFTDFENEQSNLNNIHHDFYWVGSDLPQLYSSLFVTGQQTFSFSSNFLFQGGEKIKAYEGNLSTIIQNKVSAYEFADPALKRKIQISKTDNTGCYYQMETTDKEFFNSCSEIAYSSSFPNSPYYWFFNLNSEFRFVSLEDLMNQSPITTLSYGDRRGEIGSYQSRGTLENPRLTNLGMAKTKHSYKKRMNCVDPSGECINNAVNLSNKALTFKDTKVPIRKQVINAYDGIGHYYGVVNDSSQIDEYKGWENAQYKQNGIYAFPYRITFQTSFDPALCSGKIVNIVFNSGLKEFKYSNMEYSGDWLILNSTHTTNKEGDVSTTLEVGRTTMGVYSKNPFFRDFIK